MYSVSKIYKLFQANIQRLQTFL